jgi:hypothetical protein
MVVEDMGVIFRKGRRSEFVFIGTSLPDNDHETIAEACQPQSALGRSIDEADSFELPGGGHADTDRR